MSDSEIADAAFRFVEGINRADVEGLLDLMTDDHVLSVFGEHEVVGREKQREGWRGYFDLCPDYMIHVWEMHVREDVAILVGSTTGSHLGLPRLQEFNDPLIWTAKVRGGRVSEWALHYLTDENKQALGIAGPRDEADRGGERDA